MTTPNDTPQTRIAKRLEEQERSQAWLARKLGVKRQTVGEWVRGDTACPRSRQAQIKLFLGVMPATELFTDAGFAVAERTPDAQ